MDMLYEIKNVGLGLPFKKWGLIFLYNEHKCKYFKDISVSQTAQISEFLDFFGFSWKDKNCMNDHSWKLLFQVEFEICLFFPSIF